MKVGVAVLASVSNKPTVSVDVKQHFNNKGIKAWCNHYSHFHHFGTRPTGRGRETGVTKMRDAKRLVNPAARDTDHSRSHTDPGVSERN